MGSTRCQRRSRVIAGVTVNGDDTVVLHAREILRSPVHRVESPGPCAGTVPGAFDIAGLRGSSVRDCRTGVSPAGRERHGKSRPGDAEQEVTGVVKWNMKKVVWKKSES